LRPEFPLHIKGILLFLFIPLVLFLFLRHPFGVSTSFIAAIAVMIGHRFAARPFFLNNRNKRCFWCGRTIRSRSQLEVKSGEAILLEACDTPCLGRLERFFDFCFRYRSILRAGIFIPLLWYIITTWLTSAGVLNFPSDWNRFIFQFFIAVTVVTISLAYKTGKENDTLAFPFPIHNLFLLGARNTLLVFRFVGLWWIAAGIYFLYTVL